MSAIEFGRDKGRGKDKKKRKSRGKGTQLAAAGIAGGVATVGGAVLWAKKRHKSGASGVPGFNNTLSLAGAKDALGDSKRTIKSAVEQRFGTGSKSAVTGADEFAKTYLAQAGRIKNNTQDIAKSTYQGITGASDSLVTTGTKGTITRRAKTGYASTRTNPVVEVFKGLDRGTRKVVGTAGHAGRRAKADMLVMKKKFGK